MIIEELENNFDYIQRIFIDAPWGMGKSYFGRSLEELIENENDSLPKEQQIKSIKINAWEIDYYSDPMKSLMAEILDIVSIALLLGKDKTKDIVELYKSIISEIPENKDFFEEYKEYKTNVLEFKKVLSNSKEYKLIIIDELDRCHPAYAIELLETVKHIFGVKNIIFIFLINKEQLKSTVSTMYLANDGCSEYFEKFFDIQFKLPEIDYEDFLNIEYEKYKKIETYKIEDGVSKEIDIHLEYLFLETFKSNCDTGNILPSTRLFIKIFKKYKLLLNSLSNKEKAYYPLMILLIIYFLEQELSWEKSKENRIVVFLKTFFLLKNPMDNYSSCFTEKLFDKFKLKRIFLIWENFVIFFIIF